MARGIVQMINGDKVVVSVYGNYIVCKLTPLIANRIAVGDDVEVERDKKGNPVLRPKQVA